MDDDGGMDANVTDAGRKSCQDCELSEWCFEDACHVADSCRRTFGLPCSAFGPVYLKASNVDPHDNFGRAVALSGDGNRLAVGAYLEDSVSGSDQSSNEADGAGAVYVFRRENGRWIQEAFLKGLNRLTVLAGAHFGNSLELDYDGNTLVVGASATPPSSTGAAYIFHRSGTNWAESAQLQSDVGASGYFGDAVAVSGDGLTVAVGVPSFFVLGRIGQVQLFSRSGEKWSREETLGQPNGETGSYFGTSVSLSADGSLLAVGAAWKDGIDGLVPNSGAAYVFARSNGSWSEEASMGPSSAQADDFFGQSLSLSGDGQSLLVGAPTGGDYGSAYLFRRANKIWSQSKVFTSSAPTAGNYFGYCVALSGDGSLAAVSEYGEDSLLFGLVEGGVNGDAGDSGAVFLFSADVSSARSPLAFIKAPNTGAGDRFGLAVDMSATGQRLVVGAPGDSSSGLGNPTDDSSEYSGAANVYRLAP